MIGSTISHYTILEKIGEGGMGVVYKAEDTKLKRIVALKFLPPELTRDPEAKERFIQEAQMASALDHPNICNVHEVGETDNGQMFIAMAWYEGEALNLRIAKGPLQVEEGIDVAIQIAQGLQKAHEKGIVHRDVKPANIMVTVDGVAKIMDFGLAKLGGKARLTRTGSTVGTAAYMSPEQAQGLDVDHRTDVWSLGVVLFEMSTGQLPFRGEHEAALLYSIVHEEPQSASSFRGEIPREVVSIIGKALQKDRSQRYQTVKELVKDLKSVLTHAPELPKQEKSIVVLPFENLSPDPDQEYFSDGLTEEVISDLSAVRSLRVISRSSAMTFKGTKKTIPEIARQLSVQYVLEGSVRKVTKNLRITAQLIDAQNDAHLWAEKYSGTLDDVFDIQEKVSRAIVEALKVKLTPAEKHKLAERPIENVQAYECYLKANVEVFKFTEDSINRAIQYLQHGLEIIGDNPLLFSSIALAYLNLVNIGVEQEDFLAKTEEFANKALLVDNDFPLAHAVFGWIHMYGDLVKSVYHLKRALAVNPDDTMSLAFLAFDYMQFFGKISAAVPLCEKLMRIAPLDFPTNASSSALYFYDGQFDRALQEWRKLYEMYPENAYSRFWYALILTYHHENDKAFSIIDNAAKENPDNVLTKLGLILKYVSQKNKEKAYQVMTPDFQKTCIRDASYSHHIAGFFALLNERKEALDWLESAVNHSFFNYPLLAKDPFLDNIRGEERFKKLMERVEKEWEHFEV